MISDTDSKLFFYLKYIKYKIQIPVGYVGKFLKCNIPFVYKLLKPFFPDVGFEKIFNKSFHIQFHLAKKKYKKRGDMFRNDLLKRADEVYYFGSTEQINFSSPNTILPVAKDSFFFWPNGSFYISQPFISVIKDAQIVGEHAWAFTKDRRFIVETGIYFWTRFWYPTNKDYREQIAYFDAPISASYDAVVSLVNEYAFTNYYHWIVERLTLLEGVEMYEEKTGIRPKILVHKDICPWQKELLRIFGHSESDYIYWNGGRIAVKNLLVPSMRRHEENEHAPYDTLSAEACMWIRNKIFKAFENRSEKKVFAKRIYVSRYKDRFRRIINEDEFVRLLKKFGFERYYVVGMSIEDQVSLFSGANIIIAQHGAALTNLLWAREGTKILEIQNEEYFHHNHVYFQISNALKLDYTTMILKNANKDYDSMVDIDALDKELKEYIK